MDITSKFKIVEKIIQSDDEDLLNEVKSLMGLSDNDFWAEVPTEVKEVINKAKSELDSGKGIPHSQIMVEIKSRFLNR